MQCQLQDASYNGYGFLAVKKENKTEITIEIGMFWGKTIEIEIEIDQSVLFSISYIWCWVGGRGLCHTDFLYFCYNVKESAIWPLCQIIRSSCLK